MLFHPVITPDLLSLLLWCAAMNSLSQGVGTNSGCTMAALNVIPLCDAVRFCSSRNQPPPFLRIFCDFNFRLSLSLSLRRKPRCVKMTLTMLKRHFSVELAISKSFASLRLWIIISTPAAPEHTWLHHSLNWFPFGIISPLLLLVMVLCAANAAYSPHSLTALGWNLIPAFYSALTQIHSFSHRLVVVVVVCLSVSVLQ